MTDASLALVATLARALRAGDDARDEAVDAALDALARAVVAAVPRDEHARRAFFIDVYNTLTLHAQRGHTRGRGLRLPGALRVLAAQRRAYVILGGSLRIDAIEHALLRDGARDPLTKQRLLPEGDPRFALRVPLDPRIHFTLNCGAASCPPVRVYSVGLDAEESSTALDERLELATRSFVAATTTLEDDAKRLRLSRLFRWYEADFGGRQGVRAFVARSLDRSAASIEGYAIEYERYDWSAEIRFER